MEELWLLIGLCLGSQRNSLLIFGDEPEKYQNLRNDNFRCKIFPLAALEHFDMDRALDEWSYFRNEGQLLSQFENQQILAIFKKFVKQVASTKATTSFEKLIGMIQNLVRAHICSLH